MLALLAMSMVMSSGTSLAPETAQVQGEHVMLGDAMLMLHGAGTLGWDWQNGPRGGRTGLSTNWFMAGLTYEELTARTMLSLEPATVPGAGYPQLLQTGEFYNGQHLHDHQHPHNLFMELALDWRHPLTDELGFELYGGPVGEPALGPVAFMHRTSAMDDPFPPLAHHWQDATHVTFGVATAGLFTKSLKLEGSWFNGREPDQNRWDIELREFDSWSVRLSALPDRRVALQVSYGYLASPEPPQAAGVVLGVSRVTASVQVALPGAIDASLIWGRNLEVTPLDSLLVEARAPLTASLDVYGRAERIDKTAHDLVVPGYASYQVFTVHELALGLVQRFPALGPLRPGVGVRGSLAFVPQSLAGLYGGQAEPGAFLYLLAELQ